ncbi:eosinophil peroxidase-like [Rhinoraja longicauda]
MAATWFLVVVVAGLSMFHANEANTGKRELLGSPFVHAALKEAIDSVDTAYTATRNLHKERLRKKSLSPMDLLRIFKQPFAETRTAVKSAEYMDAALTLIQHNVHRIHKRSLNASDLLSASDLDTIARITGCHARRQRPICRDDCWSNRYRTFTSVCNNKKSPRLGASNTPLVRWLPARYEDGISVPLGWTPNKKNSGFVVPLVRTVSNEILKVSNKDVVSDPDFSHLIMQWGQWIDHDMSLSPLSGSVQTYNGGIDCESTCVLRNPCFPIQLPPGDSKLVKSVKCLPFFRSAPACGTGELGSIFGDVNTRQQINAITSFIDVNEVYGSDDCLANKLRNLTNEDGLMKVNHQFSDKGRELLPFNSISSNLCGIMGEACSTGPDGIPCFIAGDARVNEQLALLAFHTMFLREHNRIARELKRLNPHWSGDTVYLEARKILGAFQQIIHFGEYLPRIIGQKAIDKYLPDYEAYNEAVNPSVANVFTSVFRFGHTTIQPFVFRLAENYQEHPQFPNVLLHQTFFAPWRIIKEGGVDLIIRGLVGSPAKLQTQDKMIHDELREKLFEMTSHLALDLGALNLQRSRDHGLAGYNAWRKFCGLSQPRNVFELSRVLGNSGLAKKFFQLYRTAENIDLWVGAISEPHLIGAKVGPLLACLLGQQFANLRNGDRYWWENKGIFTLSQRQSLPKITLARIICDNTGIQLIPRDPFKFQHFPQGFVNCTEIPAVDLSAWREDPQVTPCGAVPIVAHGHFSICDSSVKYTCISGFKLLGEDTITCVSDGQWNGAPPSCSADVEPVWIEATGPKGEKGESGTNGGSLSQQVQHSAFSVNFTTTGLKPNSLGPCVSEIYNGQNHFSCKTGKFTCRIPGVYQFSYYCATRNQVTVFLKWRGITVITSKVFDRSSINNLSGGTNLQLIVNDEVWIETDPKLRGVAYSCYFQGHLIFAV